MRPAVNCRSYSYGDRIVYGESKLRGLDASAMIKQADEVIRGDTAG